MLVLLRRKLASRIDASVDAPLAPLAALVKQFRDVDTRIRAIDLAAAEAAAQAGDDDDDNGCDDTGWDPSKLGWLDTLPVSTGRRQLPAVLIGGVVDHHRNHGWVLKCAPRERRRHD
jgi:hypothetical protein